MQKRTSLKLIVAALVVITCAVAAFRGTEEPGGLFLYCGAGIRPAIEPLRDEFTRQTGIPVEVTYAGSGCLLSMLTFAQSGDLYMPGERYYTDQAKAGGHIEGVEAVVGYFVPVVMVRKGNPKAVHSLADLARDDVRVGIGHTETVACGLIAKRILEKAGVWPEVKANIDAQGAYTGSAVELGNAIVLNALDAAINWDAMAFLVRDQTDILAIPREQNIDVEIPIAVLQYSKRPKAAREFISFLTSKAGQRHFGANGYHTSLDPYYLPYYGQNALQ